MANARVVLSGSLLTLSMVACGPDRKDDSDGGSTSGDSSGGVTDGDVSHVGEPCPTIDAAAACAQGGVAGYEFCMTDFLTGASLWSPCLTETCEGAAASRPCEGGLQYCTSHAVGGESVLLWGGCVADGECTPGETADCGFEEMAVSTSCIVGPDGVPRWDPNGCNTPLVLRFDAPVEFAPAPASAADFDLHGGPGVCVRADWPGPSTPWLALDRDRSGTIDGGHELFGSGTRLSSGPGATNGFAALAELDSDRDGKLTPNDARWSELVLWADHDGDRRASGWEQLPLAGLGLVEIDLAYERRRECDAAGNCGVERARFVYRTGGQERVGEVVDVHLACE